MPARLQVSPLLWAEDSLCDMAAVALHQRSKSHLQKVSAPSAVLEREGKITHPSIHIQLSTVTVVYCIMVTLLLYWLNCLLEKCIDCLPLGNRWVHRPGQREKLWNHGELWKAGAEHRSHCCCHCSCEGKCPWPHSLILLLLWLITFIAYVL